MGMHDDTRDLVKGRAHNFCSAFGDFHESPVARQVAPIGRNVDDLIHWLPFHATTWIANTLEYICYSSKRRI